MKICTVLVFSCWIALFNGRVIAHPIPSWKFGDSWHISVELFPRGDKANEKDKEPKSYLYDIHVVIFGPEKVDGVNCVKVDFLIPQKELPAGLTGRYRYCVDEADGWPRKVFSFRDYRNLPIDQFDQARFVSVGPEGYPVEILPAGESREAKGIKLPHSMVLTNSKVTGIRSASVQTKDNQTLEIRQTWREGEKWWRDYKRYRDGHLELKASLVEKKVYTPPVAKAEPKEKPQERPTPPVLNSTPKDPLSLDRRLAAPFSLKLQNPKVHDILDPLAKAASLTLTVDPGVDTDSPLFGAIAWGNIPIYTAMNQVAESPPIQGRWEKDDNGYVLTGRQRPLPPADPPSSPVLKISLAIAILLNVALIVALGWVWKRKNSTAQ